MTLVLALLLAFSWQDLWRDTNTHAANRRGEAAFGAKKYDAAVEAYRRAHELDPSSRSAFNLGTSQIAGGKPEEGSTTISDAVQDPSLRADALYNRGSAALAAKAYDHAVRDLRDALRTNPQHAAARRNLEIASRKREESQRATSGGKQQQQGQQSQQQQPSPGDGRKPAPKEGQPDAEALLRSVQQQEQEELSRMKARRDPVGVGW